MIAPIAMAFLVADLYDALVMTTGIVASIGAPFVIWFWVRYLVREGKR